MVSSPVFTVTLVRGERFPGLSRGVVLTFGQGDVGQLGLGPDVMERGRPTLVPKVDDIIDICAGGMHTICLNKKGKVRSHSLRICPWVVLNNRIYYYL